MGEVKMSMYFSMTLFIYCFCVEEPYLEVVAIIFFFPKGESSRKQISWFGK